MHERVAAAKDLALAGALMSSPVISHVTLQINLLTAIITALAAVVGCIIGWIRLRRLIARGSGPWWRRLWDAMFGDV